MAVGWSVPSLLECAGTLRRFKRDGHQVSIVIVDGLDDALANSGNFDGIIEHTHEYPVIIDSGNSSVANHTYAQIRAVFAMSGLPEPEFAEHFDYSSTSQKNADILADYRKRLSPDLVIMPFWKSENERDVILARSLLIACRGVGSIIMYMNSNGYPHKQFSPKISFDNLLDVPSVSDMTGAKGLSKGQVTRPEELFESHRILLLEDAENDWL